MLGNTTHVPFRDWSPCLRGKSSKKFAALTTRVVNKTANTLPKFQTDGTSFRTAAFPCDRICGTSTGSHATPDSVATAPCSLCGSVSNVTCGVNMDIFCCGEQRVCTFQHLKSMTQELAALVGCCDCRSEFFLACSVWNETTSNSKLPHVKKSRRRLRQL